MLHQTERIPVELCIGSALSQGLTLSTHRLWSELQQPRGAARRAAGSAPAFVQHPDVARQALGPVRPLPSCCARRA